MLVGPAYVVAGCRRRGFDFLYEQELTNEILSGALEELLVVSSRGMDANGAAVSVIRKAGVGTVAEASFSQAGPATRSRTTGPAGWG
ncbi:hypothetical protein T484DRAFT_1792685 [Baffinella frigidus]|nr:hypothetical protein T484DRAFT_1792685 [Cryptophyta sp. CCMP2293]